MEGGVKMSAIHAPGNVSSRGHRGRRKINNVMVSGKIYMDHPQQANYENLANAIIETAVDDYRNAIRIIKMRYSAAWNLVSPYRLSRINEVIICLDVEDFFRSEWYYTLTDVDGDYLIEKLRDEIMDLKTIKILDLARAERTKKNVSKNKVK
jgi:hypothetical protein